MYINRLFSNLVASDIVAAMASLTDADVGPVTGITVDDF
jgi:hypothetical protein